MNHCAIPAQHKEHGWHGQGKDKAVPRTQKGQTFKKRHWTKLEGINEIRDQGMRQQLCLESKRAFNKIVRQTFRVEAMKQVVGISIRSQKWATGHHGGVSPLGNKSVDCTQGKSWRWRWTGHSRWFVRTDRKKDLYCLYPVVGHDAEKKVYGSTPGPNGTLWGNHLGQAALRREQREQLNSKHVQTEPQVERWDRSDITSTALEKTWRYPCRLFGKNSLKEEVMWHTDLLLCNDHEIGRYTRAVSGQWLNKHVPIARQQILNANLQSKQVVLAIMLYSCIWEVLGLNLSQDISYPDSL
jgi:hypothetical protein